jgi:hypothetical protein
VDAVDTVATSTPAPAPTATVTTSTNLSLLGSRARELKAKYGWTYKRAATVTP